MTSEQILWPDLLSLATSVELHEDRCRYIGGSDANIILSGDADRIRGLWLEKRGEQAVTDLHDKLPVMLGRWSEAFNRQWFEKLTGHRVCDVGKVVTSSEHEWRRCTLDGSVQPSGTVWEAKHTNAFTSPEQVLERYMPQLQHNMAVTGTSRATLAVIFGNHRYEVIEVASDWLYQDELLFAEAAFWNCVVTGSEPVAVDPPTPPKPIGTREVSFAGNNAWASAAVEWLEYRDAAKRHAAATGLIKSLLEEDVTRAFGHGIEAKRSKTGAITVRELA